MMHQIRVKRNSALFGSNFIGPGPDCDPDDIEDQFGKKLIPIDEVDHAAKIHDKAYHQAKTGGVIGAIGNPDVAKADRDLVIACSKTIIKFELRMTDNITGLAINYATYLRAVAIVTAFTPISAYKTTFNTMLYLNPNR